MNRKEANDLLRRVAELEQRLISAEDMISKLCAETMKMRDAANYKWAELQEQLNARPRQTDRSHRRG